MGVKTFFKSNLETIILFILMLAVVLQRLPMGGANHLYAVAIVLFIYWCYQNKQAVQERFVKVGVRRVIIAYLVFTICFIPSVLGSNDVLRSFFTYFNILFLAFFPFIITVALVNDRQRLEKIWLGILAFVCMDAGLAIYQYFVLHIGNGFGFSRHYLSLAGYLACITPVVLVWALDKEFSRCFRGCALFATVLLLFSGFAASRSRALWCILLLLIPVILICYRKLLFKHKAILTMALVGIMLVGGFFVSSAKNMERLKSFSNTTTNGSNIERLMMWNSAIMMMKDYPLTGVGLDNYTNYYFHLYETKVIPDKYYGHPHSSYMLLGAEAGLPGFLAIIGATMTILGSCIYKWWTTKSVYWGLLLVSWMGFSIFGIIEPLILYASHTMLISFLSGCFLAGANIYKAKENQQ